MSRPFLLLPVLLAGCSDYDFTKVNDEAGADDTAGPDVDPHPDSGDGGETGEPWTRDCSEMTLADAGTLPLVDECKFEIQTGTFTPVVEWKKANWTVDSSSNQIMMMPAVASLTDDDGDGDIDTDDTPDIIAITYGSYGTLRAISGADGSEIWSAPNHQLQGQGAIAVGDIDNDGYVEIIAPTSNAIKAFEHDGTHKWTSSPVSGAFYGTSDAPAISDMDGDGIPEIIIGKAIFSNTGAVLGVGAYGRGGVGYNVGTTSFAVDLDADGTQEVVTGNALYRKDGTTIWYNGQRDGYVAVGDFDNDGQGEIVVSGEGQVRLQDTDGTVLWGKQIPAAGSTYYGGPPTVADFDGDGEPEIGVAANSSYTVFDTDGTQLWQRTTQDGSSGNTGSAVFDFEGDGVAEVVYADETRIWVFDGSNGNVKLESTEHSNATWLEYATIADVDGDGAVEIVVPNTTYTQSHSGITVIGDADNSWRPGRKIWNQHAYHITNVNDDGTIPAVADLNWLTYNNFRSGDIAAGQGTDAPDLVIDIVDVCGFECDDGLLYVQVQAGNQGFADVAGPVSVNLISQTAGSDDVLASFELSDLQSGELEAGLMLEIPMDATELEAIEDLRLAIDGGDFAAATGGAWLECDETNNEDLWGENVCQAE